VVLGQAGPEPRDVLVRGGRGILAVEQQGGVPALVTESFQVLDVLPAVSLSTRRLPALVKSLYLPTGAAYVLRLPRVPMRESWPR